jgi:hypothetical protein
VNPGTCCAQLALSPQDVTILSVFSMHVHNKHLPQIEEMRSRLSENAKKVADSLFGVPSDNKIVEYLSEFLRKWGSNRNKS